MCVTARMANFQQRSDSWFCARAELHSTTASQMGAGPSRTGAPLRVRGSVRFTASRRGLVNSFKGVSASSKQGHNLDPPGNQIPPKRCSRSVETQRCASSFSPVPYRPRVLESVSHSWRRLRPDHNWCTRGRRCGRPLCRCNDRRSPLR